MNIRSTYQKQTQDFHTFLFTKDIQYSTQNMDKNDSNENNIKSENQSWKHGLNNEKKSNSKINLMLSVIFQTNNILVKSFENSKIVLLIQCRLLSCWSK